MPRRPKHPNLQQQADRLSMAIHRIRAGRVSSLATSVDEMRSLLRRALRQPVVALRLSHDFDMPIEVRRFCQAITRLTGRAPLSPALRDLVQGWAEDPGRAAAFLDDGGALGDPQLAFLEPIATLLSLARTRGAQEDSA